MQTICEDHSEPIAVQLDTKLEVTKGIHVESKCLEEVRNVYVKVSKL